MFTWNILIQHQGLSQRPDGNIIFESLSILVVLMDSELGNIDSLLSTLINILVVFTSNNNYLI